MEQFYKEWNNRKKYWFNQNDLNDKYLSNEFGYLIDIYQYNKTNAIYGILIYDQLTRHYYRNQNANHIITYFNRKALEIVLDNKNEEFIANLLNEDWIFYMLVYRHTNERTHLLYVMNEMWKREPINKQFIKATYMRANFKEELEYYYDESEDIKYDKSILDVNAKFNEEIRNIGNFTEIPLNQKIIISLSGGVDSISCLYYLSKLTTNIIAVHINYNNRKETEEEVKFLRNICNKLDVVLFVRTINEIKRQICSENDMRDIYESYTKKIRFNSYRSIYEENEIPVVILGHNKDDCFENILTNIAYRNKYDNLKGIELKTTIEGIIFHRPLINTSKEDIYKFANYHNLPYLKNSTPDWCQRGKIRNSVVPVLNQWDTRIIDGLFNLTDVLRDLHINLNVMIEEFKEHKKENINNLNTSFLYWKYGIFKLYNFYPSNKSLKALIERLIIWKNKYEKEFIHRTTTIIINKHLQLYIWKCRKNNYEYIFKIDNNNNLNIS